MRRSRSAGRRRCRTAAMPTPRAPTSSASSMPTRSPAFATKPGRAPRNADEMHEALVALGVVADGEAAANAGWSGWLEELAASGRATATRGRRADWQRSRSVGRRRATGDRARPLSRCGRAAGHRRAARMRRRLRDARRGVARAAAGAPRRRSVRRRPTSLAVAARRWRVARSSSPCSRCRPRATCCRAGSRRCCRPMPTPSGASGTCSRASIATRSSACAARSSRSSRATSCASCSTGSTSARAAASAAPTRWPACSASSKASRRRPRSGKREILPARVAGLRPPWLDELCTAGRTLWTRLRPLGERGPCRAARSLRRRRCCCCRVAPRRSGRGWRPHRADDAEPRLARARWSPSTSRRMARRSSTRSPTASRLLRAELEDALAELVVRGRVHCDSFAGLRALLVPASKRSSAHARRRGGVTLIGIADAGRWSLVRSPASAADDAPGRRRAPRRRAARRRRARARRAHPAAPLRRRLLAPARARSGLAAAVARPRARLSPPRGARRDPRRPLHRRADRRAVRAARSDRLDARGAAPAGRRRARLPRREPIRPTCSAPSSPGRRSRGSPVRASSGATACRWRRASAVKWKRCCRSIATRCARRATRCAKGRSGVCPPPHRAARTRCRPERERTVPSREESALRVQRGESPRRTSLGSK